MSQFEVEKEGENASSGGGNNVPKGENASTGGGNDILNGENASAVGGMTCQEEEASDTSLLENRSINLRDPLLNGLLLSQIFTHGVSYQRVPIPLAESYL